MKKIFVLAVLMAGSASLWAESAIQLSLTPDIALIPRTEPVAGVSLNIWGENPQHSFALGFVNGSTGDSSGFSVGLVNYDDNYNGVQWGLLNCSRESFVGWQDGWINVAQGSFHGYQSGLVNYSEDTTGFQLGLINYARNLNGVQVGFVNVAMNNQWFKEFPHQLATGFPVVNWSF